MNEHEILIKIAMALVSICEYECCDYGFTDEINLAESILNNDKGVSHEN